MEFRGEFTVEEILGKGDVGPRDEGVFPKHEGFSNTGDGTSSRKTGRRRHRQTEGRGCDGMDERVTSFVKYLGSLCKSFKGNEVLPLSTQSYKTVVCVQHPLHPFWSLFVSGYWTSDGRKKWGSVTLMTCRS